MTTLGNGFDAPAIPEPNEPPAPAETGPAPKPEPNPRRRSLLDELDEAEAVAPDPLATARAELSEIMSRADRPQPGDGQRLLALAGTLSIDRKILRAALETVGGWNRQRDKSQAQVAKAETRLAELVGEISDLEAKRGALGLDDGYAKLHALAVAGVCHLVKTRAPNLQGGFLNYLGATSDAFGFSREGKYRSFPMHSAARREWVELLRGDVATQIIADLTRRNIARGGVSTGCSIDQLAETDL